MADCSTWKDQFQQFLEESLSDGSELGTVADGCTGGAQTMGRMDKNKDFPWMENDNASTNNGAHRFLKSQRAMHPQGDGGDVKEMDNVPETGTGREQKSLTQHGFERDGCPLPGDDTLEEMEDKELFFQALEREMPVPVDYSQLNRLLDSASEIDLLLASSPLLAAHPGGTGEEFRENEEQRMNEQSASDEESQDKVDHGSIRGGPDEPGSGSLERTISQQEHSEPTIAEGAPKNAPKTSLLEEVQSLDSTELLPEGLAERHSCANPQTRPDSSLIGPDNGVEDIPRECGIVVQLSNNSKVEGHGGQGGVSIGDGPLISTDNVSPKQGSTGFAAFEEFLQSIDGHPLVTQEDSKKSFSNNIDLRRVTMSTTSHMKTVISPSQRRMPIEQQHECSHSLKTQNRAIRRSTLEQESMRHTRTANGVSRGKADCERVKRRGLSTTYSHGRGLNSRGRGSSPRTTHLEKTLTISPNNKDPSVQNNDLEPTVVDEESHRRTDAPNTIRSHSTRPHPIAGGDVEESYFVAIEEEIARVAGSPPQARRLEEQENLIRGYQKENELLYEQLKKAMKALRDKEAKGVREQQHLRAELTGLREELANHNFRSARQAEVDLSCDHNEHSTSGHTAKVKDPQVEKLKVEAKCERQAAQRQVKERDSSAVRVQQLEKQVQELEGLLHQHFHNDQPICSHSITSSEDPGTALAEFLTRRVEKLEKEIERRTREEGQSLRKMEQQFHQVKLQYENRIEELEQHSAACSTTTHSAVPEAAPVEAVGGSGGEGHGGLASCKKTEKVGEDNEDKVNNESDINEGDKEIKRPHVNTERKGKRNKEGQVVLETCKEVWRREEMSRFSQQRWSTVGKAGCGTRRNGAREKVSNLSKHIIQENKDKARVDAGKEESSSGKQVQTRKQRRLDHNGEEMDEAIEELEVPASHVSYAALTAARHDAQRAWAESKVLRSEMEAAQVWHETQLAEERSTIERVRKECAKQSAALRTTHQQELERLITQYALQHSSSQVAKLSGIISTQESVISSLRSDVASLRTQRDKFAAASHQEAILRAQVCRLQEEIVQARQELPPTTSHFRQLQAKVAFLEQRLARREQHLQQLALKGAIDPESQKGVLVWRRMAELKTRELQRFRSELDSILEVLRELQRQGVVIPIVLSTIPRAKT
uniref:centrosomal protein of 162 kDa isoform X2 n=1 Tax=Myxine glutinosa TaxID=7769 RepID=UPI00358EF593